MSDQDIHAGSRWRQTLDVELASSNFGIICLTPENLSAPWLLFESGALSKAFQEASVIPYCLELKSTDVAGPLAQFHGVDADEDGTFRLFRSINAAREKKLPEHELNRFFGNWWPEMKRSLAEIPRGSTSTDIAGEYHTKDSHQYRVKIIHLSGNYYRIQNPDWEGVGFFEDEVYYGIYKYSDDAEERFRGEWGAHRARFNSRDRRFELVGLSLNQDEKGNFDHDAAWTKAPANKKIT